MPADSDAVGLPHVWRPLGPLIAGCVAFGTLLVVITFLWLGFDDETRASVTPFQRGTVIGIGMLGFVTMYALVRSRVEAREDRLVIVNGYRKQEFEWAEVLAVHLPPGAPWVTLDLADGNVASAMGIQASDGQRARVAVRQLRALVDRPDAPRG